MYATKKAPQLDPQSYNPDRIAINAGRIYWLAMVLLEDAQDAAVLTRQGVELLLTSNRVFDTWLTRWACKLTLKMCIAKKWPELAADQRNANAWNQAADDLELGHVQPLHGLSLESIQRAVRALPILPRFLFVLHVLERYTLDEAARMLQLDKSTCDAVLAYALAALTETVHSSELSSWIESHSLA